MAAQGANNDDPFLKKYQPEELRIASEFLTTWLPFLSRDLCDHCKQTLSDRIRSLDLEAGGEIEPAESSKNENLNVPAENIDNSGENCDTNSLGSWKDTAEPSSNGVSEQIQKAHNNDLAHGTSLIETPSPRKSWADMAQEDELEEEDERESSERLASMDASNAELISKDVAERPKLPRDQREYIRFMNVQRNKDFICFERINGKFVNILEGLELHTGVFSAVEQKRIVDFVYKLKEMGENGELKERTYTAPSKWMRGKGRVTIQFGCCYNYATDKNGNPPGILQNEMVDPLPHLFKVIIRRLVKWHVLPPTCVPDSCIVNIYEEGDCIPPHIDNHDFVRPFCTISFLSECNIVFGSNIRIEGPGEFSGQIAIPLPVGSVLVLNGNGADVAKHCVPAVPTKRISITFRRMDEKKRPVGYVPEPDLQGIQPLSYEVERTERSNEPRSWHRNGKQQARREFHVGSRVSADRRGTRSEPRSFTQNRRGPQHRPRVRVNFDSQ